MTAKEAFPTTNLEAKVSTPLTLVRFPVDVDDLRTVYSGCSFPLKVLIQQASRTVRAAAQSSATIWHNVGVYYPARLERHADGYVKRHAYWWLPLNATPHPIVERTVKQVDQELRAIEDFLVRDPTCHIVQLLDEFLARSMVDYFAEMAMCPSRSMIRGYFAERLLHVVRGIRAYHLMIKAIVAAGKDDDTDAVLLQDCVEASKWMSDLGIVDSDYEIVEQWLEVDIRNYLHVLSLLKD